MKVFEKQLFGF